MNVIDDAALLKLAEAELLGEAKRAKVRHATAGPSGWQPVPKTNKSFLINTLLQTLSRNRILANKQGKPDKSERKLLRKDKNIMKNNFIFQKPKKHKKLKKDEKNIKKCNSEHGAKGSKDFRSKKKSKMKMKTR